METSTISFSSRFNGLRNAVELEENGKGSVIKSHGKREENVAAVRDRVVFRGHKFAGFPCVHVRQRRDNKKVSESRDTRGRASSLAE